MKVSEYMNPVRGRVKGAGRAPATYRAARRNRAKLRYRQVKKS